MKKNNFSKAISTHQKEWKKPQFKKIDFIHKLTLGGSGIRVEGQDIKNQNKRP